MSLHASTLLSLALFTAGCAAGSSRSARMLAGNWREIFESRSGCSDTTTVAVHGSEVTVAGKDCEGKLDYAYSDIVYDGKRFSLKLDVPASDHHVVYRFRWLTDNDLAGDADVTTGGKTKTFPVRWTREH